MKPLASINAERFPVHQAMLFALTRLGSKTCKQCEEKLERQIERDEKAIRIPGARDLLGETRVALAIIQNKDAASATNTAATDEPPVVAEAPTATPGKGKKPAKATAGKKSGKKRK
jgi:hypothetical protein